MSFLPDCDFNQLQQCLPAVFRADFHNENDNIARAYPLLCLICTDQALLERVRHALDLPEASPDILALCDNLISDFNHQAPLQYRLPVVISEFPLHARAINQAVANFNQLLEQYYQTQEPIDYEQLENHYKTIITAITHHSNPCDRRSVWQLLAMITGWTKQLPSCVFKTDNALPVTPTDPTKINPTTPVIITEQIPVQPAINQSPFTADYHYNFNGAGRLASETDTLLLNAFGMKIGGHFDAQVKYPPYYLTVDQLQTIIHRQLSHRLEFPQTPTFSRWIQASLYQAGLERIYKNEQDANSDIFINPFLAKPLSFLSPEKIHAILEQHSEMLACDEWQPNPAELDIIAQYLFELLQGFQTNPGQSLGIGANWDGTVNLSNEAGAYSFKFKETEASWGKRFRQLSLHRQGPSEVSMNAAAGIKFELQSLFTDFEYMSQLQPSEYQELLYNALIDNVVTDLFPDPPHFENTQYQKYYKQYVITRTDNKDVSISSFYQPDANGTWFKDKAGAMKQTPMYRRAGTLDIQAFPKNTACSENSRASYMGNPLGALQLQYAQSIQQSTRGHIVYDPLGADQFLPDPFYGQVIRADNGDYLPFIGVIPKNFDKHFKQPVELCASFVIRMLHSARIMEYSSTFKAAVERIKGRFLPANDLPLPILPDYFGHYIASKHQLLSHALADDDRNFNDCQAIFGGLFKNIAYSLYETGREDNNFKQTFLTIIHSITNGQSLSRAICAKQIRDLTVNRPINAPSALLEKYDHTLNYLSTITAFFYPDPSDELAQAIASEAKRYSNALLTSSSIRSYFLILQKNQQANLSRKQTPGMAWAALKYNGPSDNIIADYKKMHQHNFPSYYLDPEGTPTGEPQAYEIFLDKSAKITGALLQLIQRYHLFAILHKPFVQPFLQSKQMAASHPQAKPLWQALGFAKGFIWDGVVIGLYQTISTPFYMLLDFLSWHYDNINNANHEHPLAISAAPANDANIRVKSSTHSRDYLLKLLATKPSESMQKEELIGCAMQLTKQLYPDISQDDALLCQQQLHDTFPLNDDEITQLFQPLLSVSEDNDRTNLSLLLIKYNASINKHFIHAVFQCLTNPNFPKQAELIIKEMRAFFSLNALQHKALIELLALYRQLLSDQSRQDYVALFQFDGQIHKALQTRDKLLQNIQQWTLDFIDESQLTSFLFESRIVSLTNQLHPETWAKIIAKTPDYLQKPLHDLLQCNDRSVLNDYYLNADQQAFLLSAQAIFNETADDSLKISWLECCKSTKTINHDALNSRDKANTKWARFAKRDIRHQLPSTDDVNDIFAALSKPLQYFPKLMQQLADMEHCYQGIDCDDNQRLDEFYETACLIHQKLVRTITTDIEHYENAQHLLRNFIDVTMNRIVNSRLDSVNLFSEEVLPNPLQGSKAIASWLNGIKENNADLRSILEQQLQQSPSLDHTLWRNKCLLEIMEASNPGERIRKTASQSLLRFWCQHRDNMTHTGKIWSDPLTGEANKSNYATLFKGSVTLEHAIKRVHDKLPDCQVVRASLLSPSS